MNRREFLALTVASPLTAMSNNPPVRLGIDLFSLRSQKWTAFQYLDYCAARQVQVVHFSEIRFLGTLEPNHLVKVREHAKRLGLQLEIGMKSICPSSKMFDASQGSAEEQLTRMIESAKLIGSPIVRCVLGSADDRKPGPIEVHMRDMVRVLTNVRSKAMDSGIKIAIENHAGDMQAHELKFLVDRLALILSVYVWIRGILCGRWKIRTLPSRLCIHTCSPVMSGTARYGMCHKARRLPGCRWVGAMLISIRTSASTSNCVRGEHFLSNRYYWDRKYCRFATKAFGISTAACRPGNLNAIESLLRPESPIKRSLGRRLISKCANGRHLKIAWLTLKSSLTRRIPSYEDEWK